MYTVISLDTLVLFSFFSNAKFRVPLGIFLFRKIFFYVYTLVIMEKKKSHDKCILSHVYSSSVFMI